MQQIGFKHSNKTVLALFNKKFSVFNAFSVHGFEATYKLAVLFFVVIKRMRTDVLRIGQSIYKVSQPVIGGA